MVDSKSIYKKDIRLYLKSSTFQTTVYYWIYYVFYYFRSFEWETSGYMSKTLITSISSIGLKKNSRKDQSAISQRGWEAQAKSYSRFIYRSKPETEFMNVHFVEVSGHNLESSQTWDFCMVFLNHRREGGRFSIRFSSFLLYSVQKLNYMYKNCKRLREFEDIEISRWLATRKTLEVCLDFVQKFGLSTDGALISVFEIALPDGETVEEIHEDHHDQEDKGEKEGVGERREGALQIHRNVAIKQRRL